MDVSIAILHPERMEEKFTHSKLVIINSTTPSPIPKTMAIWLFLRVWSSAMAPGIGILWHDQL